MLSNEALISKIREQTNKTLSCWITCTTYKQWYCIKIENIFPVWEKEIRPTAKYNKKNINKQRKDKKIIGGKG
jgi:hypothetical protein